MRLPACFVKSTHPNANLPQVRLCGSHCRWQPGWCSLPQSTVGTPASPWLHFCSFVSSASMRGQPVINEFLARRGDKRNRGKKDAAAQRRRGSFAQLGLEDAPKFSGGAALKRRVWCCQNLHPSRRRLCPVCLARMQACPQPLPSPQHIWSRTWGKPREPGLSPSAGHDLL